MANGAVSLTMNSYPTNRLKSVRNTFQSFPIQYEFRSAALRSSSGDSGEKSNGKLPFFKHVRDLITGKGWNGNWSISKESVSKLGVGVLLSYSFVSNAASVICVLIAWVLHGKKYNLSPLASGQWKHFLVIYAGLYAVNSVIRPFRASLAIALSPAFTALLNRVQEATNLSKAKSVALLVFMVNVVGTLSYLCGGLIVVTRIARVPLLP